MGSRIDVRTLKLNKWYVPKTFVLEGQENYIAIGYFDAVQLREVQINPKLKHPFISGYNKATQWKETEKEILVDYSSQEQMLFANIYDADLESELVVNPEDGTCFKEETINDFWKDVSSPYLFLSMIHINHIGNLEKVLHIINEVFEKDYLSYISFDYCDIVVFAKKIYIKDFFHKIKQVFQLSEEKGKCMVFDTFSLVSFYPGYKRGQHEAQKDSDEMDQFSATINLSVKDYDGFGKWYADLKLKYPQMRRYDMFGRHDISIVNERANSDWLLNMMERLHNKDSQCLFWTFETYIKVLEDEIAGGDFTERPPQNQLYERVQMDLQEKIDALKIAVKDSELSNKQSFILPICEVRDCICSIAKNSFAEEFIYCVFESFQHFIEYMTDKIQQVNEQGDAKLEEEKIAESYDEYFTALNTLVNSTMHSERQFIQATAFNAIFYSVPPKIMAFYNAYIYRIKQILADERSECKYTFLINPSFSPVVSVERISPEDTPPCDRILSVRIDEKALYDVEVISYQLVHELAHIIGDEMRCRSHRSRLITRSLLEVIIKLCDIQDAITIEVLREYTEDYARIIDGYTEGMNVDGARFLKALKNDRDRKLKKKFHNYFESNRKNVIGTCDKIMSDLGFDSNESQEAYMNFYSDQYCDRKYDICSYQLHQMNDGENTRAYRYMITMLKNIYSECYADMQMILVLAVNPEDYLGMFFDKHGITIEELWSDQEDLIRVSITLKVMFDCGLWEKSMLQDDGLKGFVTQILDIVEEAFTPMEEGRVNITNRMLKSLEPLKNAYKDEVKNSTGFHSKLKKRKKSGDSIHTGENSYLNKYYESAYGLYEYLLNVMKDALAEYQTPRKCDEIRKIREIVRLIFDFENPIYVFNCIEKEIDYYKTVLFGIV